MVGVQVFGLLRFVYFNFVLNLGFGLWVRFDCFCVFIYLECFLGFELAICVCFVILVWRFAFLLLL